MIKLRLKAKKSEVIWYTPTEEMKSAILMAKNKYPPKTINFAFKVLELKQMISYKTYELQEHERKVQLKF